MTNRMRFFFVLLIGLAGLASAEAALADSWPPPQRTTYDSANGTARLTVTPHIPAPGELPFVTPPRGPSAPDRAQAVLERRDERGRWAMQWQGPLVNEVMPVGAVVADSGRYFATFDDWGDTGNGPNVVVVYDGAGRTIRALSLLDLLPRDYIDTLLHTSFSIWWAAGPHRISEDGERLILSVGIPSAEDNHSNAGQFELEVALASGAPAARTGSSWDRTMAAAAAARTARAEARSAWRVYMTEPLRPPQSTTDAQPWQNYLREAFNRLAPDWQVNNARNMLVRPPGAPPDPGGFSPDPRTIFGERDLPLAIAIASPDGVPLAAALAPLVSGRRPGWLRRIRLYIVADDATWPDLVRLFAPSGATLIQLDPAEPIPQRPERLREYLETQAILTRNESAQD